MGAWGTGVFENDDASDWLIDFQETPTADRPAMLRGTFAKLLGEEEYLEIDVCGAAVAAAALVRQTRHGAPELVELDELDDALQELASAVDAELIAQVVGALNAVLDPGTEWSELWEESGMLDEAAAPLKEMLAAFAAGAVDGPVKQPGA